MRWAVINFENGTSTSSNYVVSNINFPSRRVSGGGAGGSGKGQGLTNSFVLPPILGIPQAGVSYGTGRGNNGIDASVYGYRLFNYLLQLPKFPNFFEVMNYLPGGGGGGQGGNTTTNTAGGNGGNGYLGSGGGGGGGASGVKGGDGGVGGNGFVLLCWEFE